MKRLTEFIVCIILIFSSCAKEEVININEENNPNISSNSKIANLMQRTSLKDGSSDNIIDRANCVSIQLPITIVVNGQQLIVESEDDFDTIEAIFEEFSNDEDTLEIIFPITITLSDYSQVIVNNENELSSYVDNCNGENEEDDDIECLDFQYPISAAIFNSITEQFTDITINSDEEMHDFIENLDDNDTATIQFPITIILFDGAAVVINSLDQLETEIDNVKDNCDEDDDFDFDDDDGDIDNSNMTVQEFSDFLISCPFIIDEVDINDQNLENLRDTVLTFSSDGTLTAELNNVVSSGTWSVTSNNGLRLNLTMDSLTEINNNWRLNKIEEEDDEKDEVDLRAGIDVLKLIKNCN